MNFGFLLDFFKKNQIFQFSFFLDLSPFFFLIIIFCDFVLFFSLEKLHLGTCAIGQNDRLYPGMVMGYINILGNFGVFEGPRGVPGAEILEK